MIDTELAPRERILAEATRLFVTYGYNGISMREIAEAVGVSKAGLYYHFKDKQDLFLAILGENLSSIGRLARQSVGASAREQIGQLVRSLFAQPSEQRAIIRLASVEMAHLSPQARADFGRDYQEQFIGQITAILQAGVARGELRPIDSRGATWLLLGMMYPFFAPGPDHEHVPEDTIELLLRVFFDGASLHSA
jgi:AcrR family transcriptional regulator